MVEQYIKVYEWILRHPELSRLEALIVCEVMRWPNGCYKSSHRLAWLLKSDTRTIQKKIISLEQRLWLAVFREYRKGRIYRRTMWATPKEPPIGPLFDYQQKAAKAMIKKTANKLSV